MKYDLHTHTTFCDGKNSVQEMAEEAVKKGFDVLGFSGHAHTPDDESYCMSVSDMLSYNEQIEAIKRRYAGRLEIFRGIEQDLSSDTPTDGSDVVIGSVHYVKKLGELIPIDESADILKSAAQRLYAGDFIALAQDYFANVVRIAEVMRCDIAGHFDIISKFNAHSNLFDERDERYCRAWKQAADRLIDAGIVIEINVGAMQRGYTSRPYPSPEQLRYIKERGGEVIFSGDSHSAAALGFAMNEANELALKTGFKDLFAKHPLVRIGKISK